MTTYDEKRQAKIERLQASAEAKRKEATRRYETAHDAASRIPFGQPILVGHHSEKADRANRNRIENGFCKSFELQDEAARLEARAQAIANNTAIFSDDPQASEKLEEKIAKLEARQDMMKKANALIRKNDRAGLAYMGFSESRIDELLTPDFCGRVGFADFELKNNNANLRRLKARAEQLAKQQATPDKDENIDGVKVEWRPSENRIRVIYPGRVDPDTFKKLRQYGYRATQETGTFSAYYNYHAAQFVQGLRTAATETPK